MPIFASGLQMDENKTNQTWLFNESGLEATNDAWRNRNAEDNWHCFDTSEQNPGLQIFIWTFGQMEPGSSEVLAIMYSISWLQSILTALMFT